MPRLLRQILDGPFSFTERPQPLPGDLRVNWGVALLLLVLGESRSQRASLQKLHLLAQAARTESSRSQFGRLFAGTLKPRDVVVRVEPWVNRAVAFARGAGLASLSGASVELTENGRTALGEIRAQPELLGDEKAFLASVKRKATETNVTRIMQMEPLE